VCRSMRCSIGLQRKYESQSVVVRQTPTAEIINFAKTGCHDSSQQSERYWKRN
jgi:hypothetical protein